MAAADATTRRTMFFSALAVALFGVCAIIIAGYFVRQAAPMPLPTPAQARLIAIADAIESDQPTADQTDAFIVFARRADDADLCVFPLGEDDFMRLPAPEREALSPVLIERSSDLRRLARAIAARAAEARDAGDFGEAESMIELIDRIARANTGKPSEIVLIGDITGEAIARYHDAERLALLKARGSDAPAAPE